MKIILKIILLMLLYFPVLYVPADAGGSNRIRLHSKSRYARDYASGFDRGYTAVTNACRTGGNLDNWVRDWHDWVITNPAFTRGYEEGVQQALFDLKYVEKEVLDYDHASP